MADTPEDSILNTIKTMLGIPIEIPDFDMPIKVAINSAILTLGQLGVGTVSGFTVSTSDELWSSYVTETSQLEMIKSYIFLKTELTFDPPTNAFLVTAIKEQIAELEYRLNINAEGDLNA